MQNMNALYIGRFQPFHQGHLAVVKSLINRFDRIFIGIGSSQYHDTFDNPFSFSERKTMIIKTLEAGGIDNINIVAIPDIHDPPNWVDHMMRIINEFDVVVTNNLFTRKLFEEKGFIVEETPSFNNKNFSGEYIRNQIRHGKDWENLVPEVVFRIIQEIHGEQRIKNI